MTYDVVALACEKLNYRDKLRLAQLLIQTARKEEENENPQNRTKSKVVPHQSNDSKDLSIKKIDTVEYVVERLLKLKPVKKKSLINSIKSMFQFQGGISDPDIDKIISELQKRKYIGINPNKVSYLR